MNLAVVRSSSKQISRPLKTLIPMIQSELQLGNEAGKHHFILAGEMLNEAKDQVSHGRWSGWLSKYFDLSHRQANEYMRWARIHNSAGGAEYTSLRQVRGATDRDREDRQSKQQKDFRQVLREVARDTFVQKRQSRDDEVELHRDLADELIDIGYRALATRLHPDRGGSKDAMARLNRVRDELKSISQSRRFV